MRDSGFHPFKGRVSRRFGENVRLDLATVDSVTMLQSTGLWS